MGALDGKVAIVTGGTSGIGQRIVELFVEEGAKVVMAARREREGRAMADRLGISFIPTDVSNEADTKAVVDHAVLHFGQVDCLVNNAGIPSLMNRASEIDMADFDRVMAVNVRGMMLCTKYVAPVMLAQRRGSIVNISSVAGLRGGLAGHAYSASKGAVHALTRSVAAELGDKGIRTNSISPGAIVTDIFAKLEQIEGAKAGMFRKAMSRILPALQPIPRAGTTDDVARAAIYLASDGSSFVNGHDFVVDGGHTIFPLSLWDVVNLAAKAAGR